LAFATFLVWRLRTGGYGLALAALALSNAPISCLPILLTGITGYGLILNPFRLFRRVAVISAKNHKRQRRKHQSVTAKREKSQTPKVLTAKLA